MCNIFHKYIYFELQPQIPYNTSFSCWYRHAAMLPPRSTTAAINAAVLPLPSPCCHAAAAALLPPLRCCCRCAAAFTTKLNHRHCHHAATTAAAVAKLPLLLPSCRRCHYLNFEIGLMMK
jgi:hypothetical protein